MNLIKGLSQAWCAAASVGIPLAGEREALKCGGGSGRAVHTTQPQLPLLYLLLSFVLALSHREDACTLLKPTGSQELSRTVINT